STGACSSSSKCILVSAVTLSGGSALTITFGDKSGGGSGVSAPSATGANTLTTVAASTGASSSALTAIGASPAVTVNAADGTGTIAVTPSTLSASQTGQTITETYTAPTGGLSSGEVD